VSPACWCQRAYLAAPDRVRWCTCVRVPHVCACCVCSLAQALGGTLTVANRDDGASGVRFCLTLPLVLPGDVSASGSCRPRARTPGAVRGAACSVGHVLVVDDSATNRRIAERLLRGMGCTCTLVEDGDEVPDAVAREAFDAILMDIHMARVQGDTACAALRAGGYTGPIVAVTGNATRGDAEEYRRGGFTATLGKPFGLAALRACLADLARADGSGGGDASALRGTT
jgi:CheY-like chemotaxis protein